MSTMGIAGLVILVFKLWGKADDVSWGVILLMLLLG